jgi:hypothetical protein
MDRQVPVTAVGSALAELVGGLLVGLAVLGPGGGVAAITLLLLAVASTGLGRGFWTRSGAFAFPLSLVGALAALTVSLTAVAGPPAWHRASTALDPGAHPGVAPAMALAGGVLVLASREIRSLRGLPQA